MLQLISGTESFNWDNGKCKYTRTPKTTLGPTSGHSHWRHIPPTNEQTKTILRQSLQTAKSIQTEQSLRQLRQEAFLEVNDLQKIFWVPTSVLRSIIMIAALASHLLLQDNPEEGVYHPFWTSVLNDSNWLPNIPRLDLGQHSQGIIRAS